MKKLISIISLSIILCLTTSQINPPKQFTVTGDGGQFQNILDCLEKSNENYQKVRAAQEFLLTQIKKQLADTTTKKK